MSTPQLKNWNLNSSAKKLGSGLVRLAGVRLVIVLLFTIAFHSLAEAASKQRGFIGWGEFGGAYIVELENQEDEEATFSGFDAPPFSLGYLSDYLFGSGNHAVAFDLSVTQRIIEVDDQRADPGPGGRADAEETFNLLSLVPGYRYHFSGVDAGGYIGTGLLVRLLLGGEGGTGATLALTGGYEGAVGSSGLTMGLHLFYAPNLDYEDITGLGGPMIAYTIGAAFN